MFDCTSHLVLVCWGAFWHFGVREGAQGPIVDFLRAAQMQRASRPEWGKLGLIGFSDGTVQAAAALGLFLGVAALGAHAGNN